MNVRIGLITTLNSNIGDDFIRVGLCRVLEQVFKGHQIEFVAVNKHQPHTIYGPFHPVRLAGLARFLPRGRRQVEEVIVSSLATPALSRFEHCDAIVQCGAPVLWPDCHLCEWADPIWRRIIGRIHQRTPVFNLAAGSCYPWERQPASITNQDDVAFLAEIYGYCRATTVRDSLSHLLFQGLGLNVPHIPCSALLAAGETIGNTGKDGPVLINYMPGGGHYDFGQGVEGETWRATVRMLVERLSRRHKVAFLCHNQGEVIAAKELGGGYPILWPKSVAEYFTVASTAKAGVFNRMHASVGLAGMGIPSVAIGTDTRLLMVKHLSLPCFYVKDASPERLEDELENLLVNRIQERSRLLELRAQTWGSYVSIVSERLS